MAIRVFEMRIEDKDKNRHYPFTTARQVQMQNGKTLEDAMPHIAQCEKEDTQGNTGDQTLYHMTIGTRQEDEPVGMQSFVHGQSCAARGVRSTAHGSGTIANDYNFVLGEYNKNPAAVVPGKLIGDLLVVGNGISDRIRSNALRVSANGGVYGQSAFNTSGADMAELYEWQDQNRTGEDRRGKFVTLEGDKIRLAGPEDTYLLGIISDNPSIVGNRYESWPGMYERDIYGRVQRKDGDPVINPAYDPGREYIPREDRSEWACVGMIGQMVAVDDGTCQTNGYCKPGSAGIATAAEKGYRVMKRLDESHVLVVFR